MKSFSSTLLASAILIATLVLVTLSFAFPLTSFAQPLVECGNNITATGNVNNGSTWSNECTLCDFSETLMRVLDYFALIMVLIAAFFFINAGVLYVISPANSSSSSRAHKIFVSALKGFVIILAAYLLVDLVVKTVLPGNDGNVNSYGPWNTILCINVTNTYNVQATAGINNLQVTQLNIPQTTLANCGSLGGTCGTSCATVQYCYTYNDSGSANNPVQSCYGAVLDCANARNAMYQASQAGGAISNVSSGCVDTPLNATGNSNTSCSTTALPICCPVIQNNNTGGGGGGGGGSLPSTLGDDCTNTTTNGPGLCYPSSSCSTTGTQSAACAGNLVCCPNNINQGNPNASYSCNDTASLTARFGGAGPVNAPGLDQMVACYRNNSGVAATLGGQTIYTYENNNNLCNYTNGNEVCGSCAHSTNSCHYGRGQGQGAMAADFNAPSQAGEAALCSALRAAASACGGRVLCEGNHTHISMDNC